MFTRIFTVFSGLLLASFMLSAQDNPSPYVRDGSIGKAKEQLRVNEWPEFKYFPMSEWVGKRVIFIGDYGFLDWSGASASDVYVKNKIGTVMGVEEASSQHPTVVIEMEGTKRRYTGRIIDGMLDHVAFVDELDQAKKELVGKTYWIVGSSLWTYDGISRKDGRVPVKKFSPVVVTDVVVGDDAGSPIRLILKSENGDEGYRDVNVSGTNSGLWSASDAGRWLAKRDSVGTMFLRVDPQTTYPWPKPIWDAIQAEKVAIGMTHEQVRMSWGEPESISQTVISGGQSEQWVYKAGAFVYFTGGSVSGIQNEK